MAPRPRSGVSLSAAPPLPPPATSDGVPTRTTAARSGGRPSPLAALGERGYLYALVILELAAIAGLRYLFRGNHGG